MTVRHTVVRVLLCISSSKTYRNSMKAVKYFSNTAAVVLKYLKALMEFQHVLLLLCVLSICWHHIVLTGPSVV